MWIILWPCCLWQAAVGSKMSGDRLRREAGRRRGFGALGLDPASLMGAWSFGMKVNIMDFYDQPSCPRYKSRCFKQNLTHQEPWALDGLTLPFAPWNLCILLRPSTPWQLRMFCIVWWCRYPAIVVLFGVLGPSPRYSRQSSAPAGGLPPGDGRLSSKHRHIVLSFNA